MATRLTRLMGQEANSPAIVAALVEERQRAFTLVIKTYDDARAAVAFVRRDEGDAERIAPNLYTANVKRRKANEPAVPDPAPITTTPAIPPPTSLPPTNGTTNPTAPSTTKTGPFMT